jgi:hypothetical protein
MASIKASTAASIKASIEVSTVAFIMIATAYYPLFINLTHMTNNHMINRAL